MILTHERVQEVVFTRDGVDMDLYQYCANK